MVSGGLLLYEWGKFLSAEKECRTMIVTCLLYMEMVVLVGVSWNIMISFETASKREQGHIKRSNIRVTRFSNWRCLWLVVYWILVEEFCCRQKLVSYNVTENLYCTLLDQALNFRLNENVNRQNIVLEHTGKKWKKKEKENNIKWIAAFKSPLKVIVSAS